MQSVGFALRGSGQGEIRTHVGPKSPNRFSRPARSTALPPVLRVLRVSVGIRRVNRGQSRLKTESARQAAQRAGSLVNLILSGSSIAPIEPIHPFMNQLSDKAKAGLGVIGFV